MKKRTVKKLIAISILLAIVGAVIGGLIGAYELLHYFATLERGYEAVGGEIFVFAIPFLIWAVVDCVRDTRKALKGDEE